jgi:hypothetical protein
VGSRCVGRQCSVHAPAVSLPQRVVLGADLAPWWRCPTVPSPRWQKVVAIQLLFAPHPSSGALLGGPTCLITARLAGIRRLKLYNSMDFEAVVEGEGTRCQQLVDWQERLPGRAHKRALAGVAMVNA